MDARTKKILLAEDNPADAWLFARVFQKYGEDEFQVARESSLGGVLKKLSEEKFDLILLDLFLPECNGFSSLLEILLTHWDTPVVVLTGWGDEEVALQAIRWGVQDYVFKSAVFDRDALVRISRHAIERHKHRLPAPY